ncbi:MAG: SH3 domain-containing protein, partial [Paracoccaceae bacterium]
GGENSNIQLASLANGDAAFPQPAFLDPVAASLQTETEEAPQAVEPEPQLDIREVTGSRVNMRQGPGTTYAVIGTLFYDDEVEVLEDLGNGWIQLRKMGTNEVGWMAARFVKKVTQ